MKQLCGKVYLIFWIILSKFIYFFITRFNLGSGYTLPGYLSLKFFPRIFDYINTDFKKGIILVSGTNGKTTTSKLISHVLIHQKYQVLHNHSGSNLLRGILTVFLLNYFKKYDYGVFEVDEFSLPLVLQYLKPTHLILLNLSRDQLDRYGETDIIFNRWKESIKNLDISSSVFVDKDISSFKELSKVHENIIYFEKREDFLSKTSLVGNFNAQNIGAAFQVTSSLNISEDTFIQSIESFDVAYGRGEIIKLDEYVFNIYLAKNPASFNQNLKMLNENGGHFDAVLIILNDNLPDGRDVSWIYDVESSGLRDFCRQKDIFVSGSRYLDMAVRLKYAGLDLEMQNLDKDLNKIIKLIKTKDYANICILPNYSAMLQIRKVLTGREIL